MTEDEVEDWLKARYVDAGGVPAGARITKGAFKGDASAAIFSACGGYRYGLVRIWDASKPMWLFAMLNPSVATESAGDPTVNRQVTRAKRLGGGGIIVINAGALIETNRKTAVAHPDPIGPANEAIVRPLVQASDHIVVAYGADAVLFGGEALLARVLAGREVLALRKTKKGFPGHPLYISYATQPVRYEMPPS